MSPKRKRSSSARASNLKRKSIAKVKSDDQKPTTNSKDRTDNNDQQTVKTEGSSEVKYHVGEEVQYDPVHKGSTRRAQGKVTKLLTGAKKSDPETKEVRYVIENDNTGKETIYGQHSVKKKAKK